MRKIKSGFIRPGAALAALAALGALGMACNGHSTSPTEIAKRTPPAISNLRNPTSAVVVPPALNGRRAGFLPIAFDFTDPDGDLLQVMVTFPDGPATNLIKDQAGHTSGTVSIQQSLLLPPSGQRVPYSVVVTDHNGNFSNTLAGSYIAP
jgi:hypothetical protein